jgi:pterin-4a-carbinolamine dehydratase
MRIFLSYRRKANVQRAMNLAAILRENFGKDNVFLDTDNVESGKFPEILHGELARSQLVLALISPEWLSAVDVNYRRRIDSKKDWVHIELRTALTSNLVVIPVYVGGAGRLTAEQLPVPLSELAALQSYELRDDHQWKGDVAALISRIKGNKVDVGEVRWPKGAPKYVPDPVGPLKIQDLIQSLPNWQLREFEVDDGPFRGTRGAEIKRIFAFRRFSEAIEFMYEAKDGINALQHHPRWENIFRDVVVRLTSWDIGHKITDRDFLVANYLDRLYSRYEKRWESQRQGAPPQST